MNEQIFVFRELAVFSLGSSPDVASETPNAYIWDELHTQNHLLFMQETCTPVHCVGEIQNQESSKSKLLPFSPTVFGVQIAQNFLGFVVVFSFLLASS